MRQILVVDDEVSNIDALCGILRPAYKVIVAKNGPSAIQKAVKHMPDLILLDIVMSGMSGFEVIEELKKTHLTYRIPVIFISGLGDTKSEERGLRLGAVDYITKPFDDMIVLARVRTQLRMLEYISTIEHMCQIDALTNIANRRCLDDRIVMEWNRAAREKTPFGFLMLDIDHFKKYNDKYGHPQGDLLLQSIAAIFKRCLKRPADLAARWGGEEFVILLPCTDLNGSLKIAEQIRSEVELMRVPSSDGTETNVTVSIGAGSVIPKPGEDPEGFIASVDRALYHAKSSGRNCVHIAT